MRYNISFLQPVPRLGVVGGGGWVGGVVVEVKVDPSNFNWRRSG